MSFLWALLPNQMMQWIIRTTSLPQHFLMLLEHTGMPQCCCLLYFIVIWGLFGFEVFRGSTSGLCHSTLGICLGGQKGRLFTHWLQPKWWLNILNIYYYTRTDPSAARFFFCFYPLSPISYFFIYLFDIFWIEDPRTDVFCMHFWQFMKAPAGAGPRFCILKNVPVWKIQRGWRHTYTTCCLFELSLRQGRA